MTRTITHAYRLQTPAEEAEAEPGDTRLPKIVTAKKPKPDTPPPRQGDCNPCDIGNPLCGWFEVGTGSVLRR